VCVRVCVCVGGVGVRMSVSVPVFVSVSLSMFVSMCVFVFVPHPHQSVCASHAPHAFDECICIYINIKCPCTRKHECVGRNLTTFSFICNTAHSFLTYRIHT